MIAVDEGRADGIAEQYLDLILASACYARRIRRIIFHETACEECAIRIANVHHITACKGAAHFFHSCRQQAFSSSERTSRACVHEDPALDD